MKKKVKKLINELISELSYNSCKVWQEINYDETLQTIDYIKDNNDIFPYKKHKYFFEELDYLIIDNELNQIFGEFNITKTEFILNVNDKNINHKIIDYCEYTSYKYQIIYKNKKINLYTINEINSKIPKIKYIRLFIENDIELQKWFYSYFNKVLVNLNKWIPTENKIQILLKDQNYYFSEYSVKLQNEVPFNYLYNEETLNFYQELVSSLENNNKGIYILYSEPGCGKTSFIRKLILEHKLNNKKIIYVPNSLLFNITNENILNVLNNNFNENDEIIFICEDAEMILKDRNLGNDFASSILNFSDGLLNDFRKIQFIFTHNVNEQNKIDKAFKRCGRLKSNFEFKKLKYEEYKKIFDYLNLTIVLDEENDKTLAEIFEIIELNKNINQKILKEKSLKIQEKIGFN